MPNIETIERMPAMSDLSLFTDKQLRDDIADARPFFNTYDMTRAELEAAWHDTFGV